MKKYSFALLGPMFLLSALVVGWSGCTKGPAPQSSELLIAHGRYLVHSVGMCVDCHSPRGATGAFVSGKDLMGAPIDFKPLQPMPWMPTAPRLAGLPPGYTKEHLVQYLMTGARPQGLPPTLPPMPAFRMNQADAEAIATYLASLPKEDKGS